MEEDLRTAFSALTRQTRAMVILELDAAIRDTAMEYHRSEKDVAQLLWAEIQQMQKVRDITKEIVEEFDELTRPNSSSSSEGWEQPEASQSALRLRAMED